MIGWSDHLLADALGAFGLVLVYLGGCLLREALAIWRAPRPAFWTPRWPGVAIRIVLAVSTMLPGTALAFGSVHYAIQQGLAPRPSSEP